MARVATRIHFKGNGAAGVLSTRAGRYSTRSWAEGVGIRIGGGVPVLNVIWALLLVTGLATACVHGQCQAITAVMFEQATKAVHLAIDLAAVIAFWFGISQLAEQSGLLGILGRIFRPPLRLFFPKVPKDHPVMGTVAMNVAANVLGLGNAATPFGLRAMKEFQTMNRHPKEATADQITFLVLNSATINIVPAGMVAIRAAIGSHEPAAPVIASILTTATAAFVAMTVNAFVRSRYGRRHE